MSQVSFNYTAVEDPAVRRRAQSQAKEIRTLLERTAETVIDIGRRLQEVRGSLGASLFKAWLMAEFKWAPSVAWNYMQAASVFGELDCLRQFQPSAVVALARKNVPQAVIDEAISKARAGELVTWKVAHELLKAHAVPAARKDAGTGRQRGRYGELFMSPANVGTLRDTLERFTSELAGMTEALSRSDREDLADRFLQLAVMLRQPTPIAAATSSQRSKARQPVGVN